MSNVKIVLSLDEKSSQNVNINYFTFKELEEHYLPETILSAKTIDLSHGNLTKLPHWIGELTNLEELNVSYNKLSSIPSSIGNLVNLKKLFLNNNLLYELPNEIVSLKKLKYINLSDNYFERLLNFSDFSDLEYLYLQKNFIRDVPNLNTLRLKELYLYTNNLGKSFNQTVDALSSLKTLTDLKLYHNQFTMSEIQILYQRLNFVKKLDL